MAEEKMLHQKWLEVLLEETGHPDRVDVAVQVLYAVPSGRERALDIISEYLVHSYSIIEECLPNEEQKGGVILHQTIPQITSSLFSLMNHNKEIWMPIVLKWSLSLLKKITQEYNSSVGGGAGMRVDSLVKFWVNHPIVSNLCDIMKHSIKYLLLKDATTFTSLLMAEIGQNIQFSWIFAYIMSLHPTVLSSCLLKSVLDGQVVNQRIFQMLEFAVQTSEEDVEQSLMEIVNTFNESMDKETMTSMLFFLQQILRSSQRLVHLLAPKMMKKFTTESLCNLIATCKEAEISVDLIGDLILAIINLPESLIVQTFEVILECHALWEERHLKIKEEEQMEEGELLDAEAEGHQTSYIDPISRLMNFLYLLPLPSASPASSLTNELLCCLHDVQMNLLFGTHKSGNFSSVVQFLWKLQSHSDTLVQWYCKETNKGRSGWLQIILTTLCQTMPDTAAGSLLASLFCCYGNPDKFEQVVCILQEVQATKPSVIQYLITSLPHNEATLVCGLQNLERLCLLCQSSKQSLRASLAAAIQFNITELLESLLRGVSSLAVLTLLKEVNIKTLSYGLQMSLTSVLLTVFKRNSSQNAKNISNGVQINQVAEAVLLKILPFFNKLTNSSQPLASFAAQAIIKSILDPEVNIYLMKSRTAFTSPARVFKFETQQSLLSLHQSKGDVRQTGQKESIDPHTGTLGSRRTRSLSFSSRAHLDADSESLSRVYFTEQMVMLIQQCCRLNNFMCQQVVRNILLLIAPVFPPGKQVLNVNDETQKMLTEWELTIKKKMESSAIFWYLLFVVAEQDPASLNDLQGVVISLFGVMAKYWYFSRANRAIENSAELDVTCFLVQLCRKADWLDEPLNRVDELFELISPYEIYVLLDAMLENLKEYFSSDESHDKNRKRKSYTSQCQLQSLKAILRNNASKLKHLFSKYYPIS